MSWIRTDVTRSLAAGPAGYSPANLQSAYNLVTVSATNGGTQVVAIVDATDDPKAEADLGVYRSTFGLASCTTANGCFLKVNQSGLTSPLPPTDKTGGWAGEESLDLDMVSAICPNCEILLVEAQTSFSTDLYAAEDAATACGANVVSNSWGSNEYSSERGDETHFQSAGVMITFAAGDNGFRGKAGYPATSRYVTSVGGTTLNMSGASWTETVWPGSGSGCSLYIGQPAWQTSLGSGYTSGCGNRIDNDVAADGDPNTGVAVYDSFGGTGAAACSAWCVYGGTSASAPIIAGVYGLAANGGSITGGSYSYSHASSSTLRDITSGSNGSCSSSYLCTAKVGYDGPSGNGSPNGIGAF